MSNRSDAMRGVEGELRRQMKEMLTRCTPQQFDVFQRMYDHRRKFDHPVDAIPLETMDWAFQQIEKTLAAKEPGHG